MRLLSGPSGSGKTTAILDEFRAQTGANVRLLVPTATMAQHLQNQLAREGHVFRRSLIQTLSAFVRDWVEDKPEVPRSVLHLLTEEAARRVAHPDFAGVVSLPGFSARLAATIHEFSGAGCDSERLAAHLPNAPLADAFLTVYREVDRELARRNLATRARRLQLAAERITAQGTRGVTTFWLDGFHALPDPELAVIAALAGHADVTLALDTLDLTAAFRSRLVSIGLTEQRLSRRRARPAIQSFQAGGVERETDEIARRILEQAASGRAFREMAIIVRAAENYVPVLRGTLSRFGIPAHFYFDQDLDRHPAVRFLSGAIDALLSGWDHSRVLAVLRLAPRFAALGALDRFDFEVRDQIPNSGLATLRGLLLDAEGKLRASADKIAHKLDRLATLEEWHTFSLHPKNWAARFKTLRNIFRPARPTTPATHDLAFDWRSQSAALDAFDEALDEAALALDPAHELGLNEWWRTVKSVLRLKPLRLADGRRNVVHVLSAYEAREWALPVVFICGMVENQFPRAHTQDPFFPHPARCRLHADGIRVRTAAEFELDERTLFEGALDSATMLVSLSWPEFDGRGESTLKSLFLDEMLLRDDGARNVRPPLPKRTPVHASAINDEALLPILRARTATFSPTGLESFLQCPFQFFAGKTLRLRMPPDRPEDRLDFMTQGEIVHEVLKEWWNRPQDIGALFERVFERKLDEKHVPFGYHTERLRNQMFDDLRRFVAHDGWRREIFTSRTELPFDMPVGDFVVRGKIDRLDTSPDGKAFVIDYKYSAPVNVKKKLKNENLLQAPLYMLAARDVFHARPEGMFYVGVKSELVYVGWSESPLLDSHPLPENWLAVTLDRTIELVAQIRSGNIAPHPADRDNCRLCDYHDACRIDVAQHVEITTEVSE
jgi:ATP-dependent helicase/DNAse subunit B